jgi:hypothetical protein
VSDLIDSVLTTYGGRDRWEQLGSISAQHRFGGALWDLKGVPGIVEEGELTVQVQREHASLRPFTAPDRHSTFTPGRVSVETADGEVVEALDDPRSSFAGHTLTTPWTHLQLAYFTGHAMWTYLVDPYLLTWPGVQTEEIDPWDDEGETWRRLRVSYPADVATMSPDQVLYVDDAGLIRRRDYQVDVAGGSPAAHYVTGHQLVDGVMVPTSRRIYVRGEDNRPVHEQLVVSIELSGVTVGGPWPTSRPAPPDRSC